MQFTTTHTTRLIKLLTFALVAVMSFSFAQVTGRNLSTANFAAGAFVQVTDSTWHEINANGEMVFSFDEVARDDWSVYLFDSSRDMSLQLDVHRMMVMLDGGDLYAITHVGKALSIGFHVEAGPIWNQGDAESKCPALAERNGAYWTGGWMTTVQGAMSTCTLEYPLFDWQTSYDVDVEAGPIWNQSDAESKCEALAAEKETDDIWVNWTGQWATSVEGEMSVCRLSVKMASF